ncbi:MAG: NAD(P)-binding protein, partial [Gammaproteobacteria bacterium]
MTTIAVVGAGLSGLVAAHGLSRDHDVTVFEKSRSVGGRIATRYAGGCEFDHGAQFFIARSAAFQAFLRPLIEQGMVASWPARFAELERSTVIATRHWHDEDPHYVGTPRMNAIGKWLATGLDIRLLTTVARLERRNNHWLLFDSRGLALGQFDWVIVTAPAPQTAALLAASERIRQHSEAARMQGCFA